MAKAPATVLLNEVQMATLQELEALASDGVVFGNIMVSYKQNVVKALLDRGVFKPFRGKHFKRTNVPVAPKPPVVSRKAKTGDSLSC